jgi:hypothetical protein
MIGAILMKFGLTPTTWTKRMTAQVKPLRSILSMGKFPTEDNG